MMANAAAWCSHVGPLKCHELFFFGWGEDVRCDSLLHPRSKERLDQDKIFHKRVSGQRGRRTVEDTRRSGPRIAQIQWKIGLEHAKFVLDVVFGFWASRAIS